MIRVASMSMDEHGWVLQAKTHFPSHGPSFGSKKTGIAVEMLNEGALYSSEKSMSIIATSAFYQFCAGSFQNHVGETERQI